MTTNDSSQDDDDYDADGGGDDDDVGDDDDDDRAGDDDDAFLSCDTLIVIPIHNRWAKFHPPLIGKATLTPNPEVVLLSPRSHTWLEANGFKYRSSPRLIPPRSQPLVQQCRIWLKA